MKHWFTELIRYLENGQRAVLITIISSSGSSPRKAGTHMAVGEDGTCMGTIGGGAVEYEAIKAARKALVQKTSFLRSCRLEEGGKQDMGMICGGEILLYFQYMDPEVPGQKELYQEIQNALERNEDSWLLMDITDEANWQIGLYRISRGFAGLLPPDDIFKGETLKRPFQKEMGGRRYYGEPLVRSGLVYIFGGGHVARELVPLLTHLGFGCIVMDDRREFAASDRFPDALQVIAGDLEHIEASVTIRPEDYVCIMTRGHQFDYSVQKQVLSLHPRYIGVMGSRNKIRLVTEKLLSDGFSREAIERCHMPIGIPIRSETPAEIAVSIAGELIAIRRE